MPIKVARKFHTAAVENKRNSLMFWPWKWHQNLIQVCVHELRTQFPSNIIEYIFFLAYVVSFLPSCYMYAILVCKFRSICNLFIFILISSKLATANLTKTVFPIFRRKNIDMPLTFLLPYLWKTVTGYHAEEERPRESKYAKDEAK